MPTIKHEASGSGSSIGFAKSLHRRRLLSRSINPLHGLPDFSRHAPLVSSPLKKECFRREMRTSTVSDQVSSVTSPARTDGSGRLRVAIHKREIRHCGQAASQKKGNSSSMDKLSVAIGKLAGLRITSTQDDNSAELSNPPTQQHQDLFGMASKLSRALEHHAKDSRPGSDSQPQKEHSRFNQ
ncbi:hypothetical protein XA68_11262 [Ophiocordyceps unilateralis]|uniref:Uncharacterized protein n=1 Tax=Ophiocordyceps unilateralis TaxID=268505 RepID=A0A2A9PFG8_OPHUN|nr:hypothetical protein XA68_11262 [Ophiocordyceps unilateralis]